MSQMYHIVLNYLYFYWPLPIHVLSEKQRSSIKFYSKVIRVQPTDFKSCFTSESFKHSTTY